MTRAVIKAGAVAALLLASGGAYAAALANMDQGRRPDKPAHLPVSVSRPQAAAVTPPSAQMRAFSFWTGSFR
jgi:hypothetical protein